MELKEITVNDISIILKLIKLEFPYLSVNRSDIEEKLASEKFHLLKLEEKSKIIGFTEIEFLEGNIARINALIVTAPSRGKNYGKKLLEETIKFIEEKNIKRITLLVKEDNKQAKKMYASFGFKFVGLYQQWSGGLTIEELELDLEKRKPSYVT